MNYLSNMAILILFLIFNSIFATVSIVTDGYIILQILQADLID